MTPNQPEPGAEAVEAARRMIRALASTPVGEPGPGWLKSVSFPIHPNRDVEVEFASALDAFAAQARREGAEDALATLRDEVLHNTEGYDNDTVNHYLGLIDSQPIPTTPPAASAMPARIRVTATSFAMPPEALGEYDVLEWRGRAPVIMLDGKPYCVPPDRWQGVESPPTAAQPQPVPSAFCDLWQHDETGRLLELPMHAASPGPRWAKVKQGGAQPRPPAGEREAFEAWWNTGGDTLGIPVDSFDLEYKCKEFARAAWQARAGRGPA